MENHDFWNMCSNGSIREDVAKFIDSTSAVAKLKDAAYYEFEDALVNFLQNIKEKIYRECDREYLRDDVINHIASVVGEQGGEIVAQSLPIEVIDNIAQDWNSQLENDDTYWESVWGALSDTIDDNFCLFDDELSVNDAWIYAAYLNEWFSSHPDDNMQPASISEFFGNEMADDETNIYYTALALEYKKKFE